MSKRQLGRLAVLVGMTLAFGVWTGCNARTDKSEGTVILSITDFDGLPLQISVNNIVALNGALLQVGEITLQNFPKDPQGVTSDLQSIELKSMEVTFARLDTGTRVPPPRLRTIFGLVPVGGTNIIENIDVMGPEQFLNPPLSDLLFENGAVDSETGSFLIVLDIQIRFFGRTLAGDEIASARESFRVEFVP